MRWPRAHAGAAHVTGILRSTIRDFEVTETLAFEPEGEGEHLYLLVEKRDITTRAVQRMLAGGCDVPVGDVSYAGMKDKRAVARQWFSVRRPRREANGPGAGVSILRRIRHGRKLRRGQLRENRFRIRIRALSGDPDASLMRLRTLGAPNYFGQQRFGVGGKNVPEALDWVRAGKPRISPFLRSVYLSSLRGFLFNEALGQRVADGTWRYSLDGEAELNGSPTGPLWGRGRPKSTGAARVLEERAVGAHGEIAEALEFVGLRQQRRPLAAMPKDLSWRMRDGQLTVEFALDRGTYATAVLREIGRFQDAARDHAAVESPCRR